MIIFLALKKDQGLPSIASIRGLARELEDQFPGRYNTNRLHWANKNGIRYASDNLINDISTILMIDNNELIRKPFWFKKRCCKHLTHRMHYVAHFDVYTCNIFKM